MALPHELVALYDQIELLPIQGAIGRVCRCVLHQKTTVVKYIEPVMCDTGVALRFRREVESLSAIDHPNVVQILGRQLDTEPYWYEMEYAEHGDLERRISGLSHNLINIRGVFRQICYGVQRLHDNDPQIVHRDLKPRNILLFPGKPGQEYSGQSEFLAKVADLGHVRIASTAGDLFTEADSSIGTEAYMSPQQREDPGSAGVVDDVYALGVVLIEICTGEPDIELADEVYLPLRSLVKKMVAHHSDERFQNVGEVLAAIDELETQELFENGLPTPDFRYDFLVDALLEGDDPVEWRRRLRQLETVFSVSEADPTQVVRYATHLPDELVVLADSRSPASLERIVRQFIRASDELISAGKAELEVLAWADFLSRVYGLARRENVRWVVFDALLYISLVPKESPALIVVFELLRTLLASGDTATARKAITASRLRDDLAAVVETLVSDGEMCREVPSAFCI